MTEYAAFELQDVKFTAYGPEGPTEPQEWYIKAVRGEEVLREIRIPLEFRPIFGYDISDVQNLNEATEKLIKELGLE